MYVKRMILLQIKPDFALCRAKEKLAVVSRQSIINPTQPICHGLWMQIKAMETNEPFSIAFTLALFFLTFSEWFLVFSLRRFRLSPAEATPHARFFLSLLPRQSGQIPKTYSIINLSFCGKSLRAADSCSLRYPLKKISSVA